MSERPGAVEALAALGSVLRYPDEGTRRRLAELVATLAPVDQNAADEAAELLAAVADLEQWELEELYTRTFDLDPVVSLEAGWHLYGEQYERGRLLVRCRDLLRRAGVPEANELPDHLPSLFIALPRLHAADRARFAATILAPAITIITSTLSKRQNLYAPLLRAAERLVYELAGDLPVAPPPHALDPELVQIGHSRLRSTP